MHYLINFGLKICMEEDLQIALENYCESLYSRIFVKISVTAKGDPLPQILQKVLDE